MSDENVVEVKKKDNWLVVFMVLLIVFLFSFIVYVLSYNAGLDNCPVSNISMNDSFNRGFVSGTDYGVNISILSMLHYAQNCSVVRINYSNNIYGFVDATCVIPINRTVG